MEATRIMCGDLLRTTKKLIFDKGSIVKVCGVNADATLPSLNLKGYADCCLANDDEYRAGVWLAYLEPIPLTPEFLAKYFGEVKKGRHYGLYDDYYDIDIREWSDGIWIFVHHCTEMATPDEQVTVSYVHELQHILRHCALDELADKFKA